MTLSNKIALVTGANRGIGAAIVREMLKAGVAKCFFDGLHDVPLGYSSVPDQPESQRKRGLPAVNSLGKFQSLVHRDDVFRHTHRRLA